MTRAKRDPGDSPRSPAPSYQSYLEHDSRPVPPVLLEQSCPDLGTDPLAAERYTSREFFELEAERLWPRVWQMVCREEELADVGDAQVYDIVGKSFVVLRTASARIQAFYNSCTHRGRKLMTSNGRIEQFRCGFHGIAWDLHGKVKFVPCRWDFEHVGDDEWRLPEARVDTWGGFVFINMDPDARPLAEYLEVLPAHFSRWRLEDCYKAVHVAKVIRANWKVAQEAFMESYHVIATHPQILSVIADANSQYDVYGAHVNRNLAAFGAPSPHLGDGRVPPAQTIADMLRLWGRAEADAIAAREGDREPRRVLGELARRALASSGGESLAAAADAELLDALVYNVFPNFAPWGGFAPNIVYRWRPRGRDVDACIMDVMILKRCAPGQPRPAPVPVHWLTDDQPWTEATELPILGAVIEQDMQNMPYVQEGLVASGTGRVQLGRYQESRIRHFHRTLDEYLARAD